MIITINSAFGAVPFDARNSGEKNPAAPLSKVDGDSVVKYLSDNHSFAGAAKAAKKVFSMNFSSQVGLSLGALAAGCKVMLFTGATVEILVVFGVIGALAAGILVFNDQVQEVKNKKNLSKFTATPLRDVPIRVIARFKLDVIRNSVSFLCKGKMKQHEIAKTAGLSLAAAFGTVIALGVVVNAPFRILRIGLAADAVLAKANFSIKNLADSAA